MWFTYLNVWSGVFLVRHGKIILVFWDITDFKKPNLG